MNSERTTLKADILLYEIVDNDDATLGAQLTQTIVINGDVFRLITIRLTRTMMTSILTAQDCEF